jgi:phospholipase/carboxylesterase
MRRLPWLVTIVLFAGLAPACERAPASIEPVPQVGTGPSPSERTAAPTPLPTLKFRERILGDADPAERLPMIVAIHGLGDRPESFGRVFDRYRRPARLILPQGIDPHGDGFSWFPFRRDRSNPAELASGMRRAADQIAALLGELIALRPTRGRPVVTGFSQGGMLAFTLAATHPDRIAGAVPMGGWLPPPLWPGREGAPGPRVVALHGDADAVVPIAPTREAVAHLAAQGRPVELRELAGVGHTVSPEMRTALFALLEELSAKP